MSKDYSTPPAFSAPYGGADENFAARLFTEAKLAPDAEARIDGLAAQLLEAARRAARARRGRDFLREYSLSSEEGLALMVLAESLLRVPDDLTADRLIEDKLAHPPGAAHAENSEALLVQPPPGRLGSLRASSAGKDGGARGRSRRPGAPDRHGRPARRRPPGRAAHGVAFRFRSNDRGRLGRACRKEGRRHRYSFDMLGEGARTEADARPILIPMRKPSRQSARRGRLPERPGISVKLSALHPRFEPMSRRRVLAELVRGLPNWRDWPRHDLNFTIDAEEADRLELSLDIVDVSGGALACGVAGLWSRGAGLSEAGFGGDRPCCRGGAPL